MIKILLECLDEVCRTKIKGAKVSDLTKAGQEERVFDIADDHPLLVGLESGECQTSIGGFENAVEHFAFMFWSFRHKKVSAFTLRHSTATDFKK